MDVKPSALQLWREKLESFLREEAITADPEKKFQLTVRIREARQKITELEWGEKSGRLPDDLQSGNSDLESRGLGDLSASRAANSARVENPEEDRANTLRIFISYSFQDLPLVRRLRAAFAAEGYSVWVAEDDAKVGSWLPQITAAIRGCDLFVIALTSRSRESVMVQNEILEAQKQGRQMLIIRMESGVDLGEYGPVLNVWQRFDWKKEQIPRILRELRELDGRKTSQSSISPVGKPEKRRSIPKFLTIAAAVLFVLGIGVWFQWAQTQPGARSVPAAGAPLVLAVLPFTDFSDTAAENLRYCTLLRNPLGSAFVGASKLSFWPEDSELTALSKAARDFSDSKNFVSIPTGACVVALAELTRKDADPSSAELFLSLLERDADGTFGRSLHWMAFFLKNRSYFSGPADSPHWIAARAGVELARFLVKEGLIQIKDKDRLTANLTEVLLEAALRSPSVQPKISAELYASSTSAPTESGLEALLEVPETKPAPRSGTNAVEKATSEVKANLAPFASL
jgi:hypothetical protein